MHSSSFYLKVNLTATRSTVNVDSTTHVEPNVNQHNTRSANLANNTFIHATIEITIPAIYLKTAIITFHYQFHNKPQLPDSYTNSFAPDPQGPHKPLLANEYKNARHGEDEQAEGDSIYPFTCYVASTLGVRLNFHFAGTSRGNEEREMERVNLNKTTGRLSK